MVKKERIGVVLSDKPQKTIVVGIQTRYQHPKYGKILIKTKRYMVHDEENHGKPGDIVLVQESAPFSKHKKWILKSIIRKYQEQIN